MFFGLILNSLVVNRTTVCERYQNVSTVDPVTRKAFGSPQGAFGRAFSYLSSVHVCALAASSPHLLSKVAGTQAAPVWLCPCALTEAGV